LWQSEIGNLQFTAAPLAQLAEQLTLKPRSLDSNTVHATKSATDQESEFDFFGSFGGVAKSPAAARVLKRAISDRRVYWHPWIWTVSASSFFGTPYRHRRESGLVDAPDWSRLAVVAPILFSAETSPAIL